MDEFILIIIHYFQSLSAANQKPENCDHEPMPDIDDFMKEIDEQLDSKYDEDPVFRKVVNAALVASGIKSEGEGPVPMEVNASGMEPTRMTFFTETAPEIELETNNMVREHMATVIKPAANVVEELPSDTACVPFGYTSMQYGEGSWIEELSALYEIIDKEHEAQQIAEIAEILEMANLTTDAKMSANAEDIREALFDIETWHKVEAEISTVCEQ